MADQRRAGLIQVMVGGVLQDAKGDFEYMIARVKREDIVGSDGPHGFKETAKVPYIKGTLTDRGTLDVKALTDITDTTVTLKLSNGKTIMLSNAWYAGEGTGKTSEAEIDFEFHGLSGEEV